MKNKNKPIATTDCNREQLTFTSIKSKKIVADFLGGRLSSDAGVLLLREIEKKTGLIKRLSGCVKDTRNAGYVKHSIETLLAQRVYSIALGYEDLNDHTELRADPALQTAVDKQEPLASAPTLCRFENGIDRQQQVEMAKIFVEQFIDSFDSPPEELILDFDATDDPVYGNQVGRFFHGYYDHYCFLPLYVFCNSQLLISYLRPSKIDGAKHSRAILKLLVERFRQQWPDVKIIFRGDSGFCRWRILKWCDRHKIDYIVGLAKNQRLTGLAQDYISLAEEQFSETTEKQRLFADIQYRAGTWDKERRVIVKAEHLSKGANTRYVVTSLDGDSQRLYDGLYCMRGEMENRIKEQQLCLFADRTSCHEFLANQFRVLLSGAAYILVENLRRIYLVATELENARVDTIRLKLFKVAARVVYTSRRIVFHLCSSYPYKELLQKIQTRLLSAPNHTASYP